MVDDVEGATFLILTITAAFITAGTVGNDAGVHRPDVEGIASFCLRGLGADLNNDWYGAVSHRLRLPTPPNRALSAAHRRKAPTPVRRRAAG